MGKHDETSKGIDGIHEISQVLHGQKSKLGTLEADICEFAQESKCQGDKIDDLLSQTNELCEFLNVDFSLTESPIKGELPVIKNEPEIIANISWDEILNEYESQEDTCLNLDDLLNPSQIAEINSRFDKPLRRIPWNKSDYIVIFGAGLTGIITDWFCAPIENPLSKKLLSYGKNLHDEQGMYKNFHKFQNNLKNSSLANRFSWVNKIATMQVSHNNLPIDYKGKHFGGPYHRILSGGHDLLRFMSGIWQIKNGQFIGVRYENGQAIMDIIDSQNAGQHYVPQDWATAAIEYLLHVVADFFTKTSLPIPGITLLRELPIRELRKFIYEMYKGGYNLRHVVGQAVTPAVTSLIVWLYDLIQYRLPKWVKVHLKKEPVEEEPVPGLKFNEMMATAHTFVAAVNIGRVVINKKPTSLNLPQIIMCVKTIIGSVLKNIKRYNLKHRLDRNKIYLEDGWDSLETFVNLPLIESMISLPDNEIILN